MPKRTLRTLLVCGFATLSLIVICIGLLKTSSGVNASQDKWLSDQSKVRQESPEAARQRMDKEHDAALVHAGMALVYFKRGLLNPDSLKIAEAYRMGDLSICMSYRAQNAVGGPAAGEAVYVYIDDALISERDAAFKRTWKQECKDRTPDEDVTRQMQAMQ